MKNRFNFLIFDWSGVISNDMAPTFETYNLLFRHYGVPEITLDYFQENFELPYSLFTEKHLPGIPLAEIQDKFRDFFKTVEATPQMIPGVAPVLKEIQSRGYKMSVLSSHPYVSKETQLFFPGENFFAHIFEDIANKIDWVPELLKQAGFQANETLYIGDMVHDIEAGKKGNVTTAGVLTGYQSATHLKEAGADFIIKDLEELLSHL